MSSKVVIKECPTYELNQLTQVLNEGMDELGGWETFVKPGDRVLLKVNMIGPKSPDSAAVTHKELVRALTRVLKKLGCEVWIGDSSGGAILGKAITGQSFYTTGYEEVAKEEGAILKNFDKEGVVSVTPPRGKEPIHLAKPIYDADVVINVPKFKTHSMGVFTGAIKNVFGCIPGLQKANYHKTAPTSREFGEILVDIHQSARFHLHIMDAVFAMQGDGPTAGSPYAAGKLLIGTDPLALDTVAVDMLGLQIEDLPIFTAARERGIGKSKLDQIEVKGDFHEIPRLVGFKLPKLYLARKTGIFQVLVPLINLLKTKPVIDLKECKHCNVCVESCPVAAIEKKTKNIDYNLCIECLCCHELCLHQAVDLKRRNPLSEFFHRV